MKLLHDFDAHAISTFGAAHTQKGKLGKVRKTQPNEVPAMARRLGDTPAHEAAAVGQAVSCNGLTG